ncbi:uncharacterized protein V1516DRAFT_675367 [Lipomyces oligophaga]|uniref:uncharacterized protein n=1 Tax=Lipomyces oligophaga TaxID=45792 RepID=UPI0034CF83B4
MDTAYDAIQQSSLPDKESLKNDVTVSGEPSSSQTASATSEQTLQEEFSEAMQTIQESAWGATIGGFWQTMKKQGGIAIEETRKDISVASELASKEFASITTTLRSSTIANQVATQASQVASQASTFVATTRRSFDTEAAASAVRSRVKDAPASTSRMFAVLKEQAQKRLDEIDKVEFSKLASQVGKEVNGLLRDVVSVEPGEDVDGINDDHSATISKDLLYEVPDDIKRQIYTTRLDAQLHALHTSVEPFLAAESGDEEFSKFSDAFSVDAKTEPISDDLEHYPELRKLMEKLVPDKITYTDFWKRYYFLREQINQEEARRKQLLTEAGTTEDNFNWDDDDDEDQPSGESSGLGSSEMTVKHEHVGAALTHEEGSSSRPSTESSYDLVSKPASNLDLVSAGAQAESAATASKTEGSASNAKPDDEEDDWE